MILVYMNICLNLQKFEKNNRKEKLPTKKNTQIAKIHMKMFLTSFMLKEIKIQPIYISLGNR